MSQIPRGASDPRAYLLDHDAVDAHVFVAPEVVEQIHPAQRQAHHQEAQVLLPAGPVQPGRRQEEQGLQEAGGQGATLERFIHIL